MTTIKRHGKEIEIDYSQIFQDDESKMEFISTVKDMKSVLEDLEKELESETKNQVDNLINDIDIILEPPKPKPKPKEKPKTKSDTYNDIYNDIYSNLEFIEGSIEKCKIIIKSNKSNATPSRFIEID